MIFLAIDLTVKIMSKQQRFEFSKDLTVDQNNSQSIYPTLTATEKRYPGNSRQKSSWLLQIPTSLEFLS